MVCGFPVSRTQTSAEQTRGAAYAGWDGLPHHFETGRGHDARQPSRGSVEQPQTFFDERLLEGSVRVSE